MVDYRSEDREDHATTAESDVELPAVGGQRSSVDESLSLLSSRRRRDVLYCLSETEVASIESLATSIAAREVSVPAERVSPDDRERLLIDLYHTHLPKLADRGLIEYDQRSGTVRWSTVGDELETLLERCYELEAASP
ncbi:hypothetical protein QA600_15900 [Natronococcus sp. A-GB1]|uniref:DUF7344 domain-containing protein n=1 Tax=Natronococcus sp. A-GB1 TaxID=3037648 RepID=UPI00241EE4B8|nr:hypothetical protein [Natronococcus sp. A-GB1]MDG5760820.1 hypothetical protein [Natronococcus sp. A-GB1]